MGDLMDHASKEALEVGASASSSLPAPTGRVREYSKAATNDHIRLALDILKINHEQLGALLGYSPSSIREYDAGKRPAPYPTTLAVDGLFARRGLPLLDGTPTRPKDWKQQEEKPATRPMYIVEIPAEHGACAMLVHHKCLVADLAGDWGLIRIPDDAPWIVDALRSMGLEPKKVEL